MSSPRLLCLRLTKSSVLHPLEKIAVVLHDVKTLPGFETLEHDLAYLDHLLVQITRINVRLGSLKQDLPSATFKAIEVLRTCKIFCQKESDSQLISAVKSCRERKALLRQLQEAIAATSSEGRTELLKSWAKTDEGGHLRMEYLSLLQTVVLLQEGKRDVIFQGADS